MGLMLYQTFCGYNKGKIPWAIFASAIMLLYIAWFGNAVFKEANECSPYELSPELGEVVLPNRSGIYPFDNLNLSC